MLLSVVLDGAVTDVDATDIDASNGGELIVLGNMYGQGNDQPVAFVQPEVSEELTLTLSSRIVSK